ncbi:hypothetical protein BDY21DRAFT_165501 [Lineolata rhizophorae]|uniref:Uncharacterized protein n=1 Tax=Lineolata rhizophorae TaxID=578093 RepID=A0A6A6P924_9PEZI|nr:hypothetical protein BDY21DRAFT_165501 [Lineolata rhizophorae]
MGTRHDRRKAPNSIITQQRAMVERGPKRPRRQGRLVSMTASAVCVSGARLVDTPRIPAIEEGVLSPPISWIPGQTSGSPKSKGCATRSPRRDGALTSEQSPSDHESMACGGRGWAASRRGIGPLGRQSRPLKVSLAGQFEPAFARASSDVAGRPGSFWGCCRVCGAQSLSVADRGSSEPSVSLSGSRVVQNAIGARQTHAGPASLHC